MTGQSDNRAAKLNTSSRVVMLVFAFTGWMFAGAVMALIPLAGRAAVRSMAIADEAEVGRWFAWYICAFLLGAAAGGLLFGWLGDRIGRAKAMALSILCYSIVTGVTFFVSAPWQLLVLRFVACLGVGGMWPNGVALISEAWSDVSRPLLSGLIGMSANLGFMMLSAASIAKPITPENWRWVTLAGAAPVVVGVLAWFLVPESPRWRRETDKQSRSALGEMFRPPLLRLTLIGICLGAVPLMGNWGSANWMVPWAGQVGGADMPELKAWTQWSKSSGGALGALLGGWLASQFGLRKTYFMISAASLALSSYIFFALTPVSPGFLYWVFGIGFFGTLYFGWLPLYLPELFPTRLRATGGGISFNWGRILTALGVLGTGQLMVHYSGDYSQVGQLTCLVYVAGLVVILFAPDTSKVSVGDVAD